MCVCVMSNHWSNNIGKIIGVGRNYAQHARELGNPIPGHSEKCVLFSKLISSILPYGNGEPIIIPNNSNVHHEVELGIIIGTRISNKSFKNKVNNRPPRDVLNCASEGIELCLRGD